MDVPCSVCISDCLFLQKTHTTTTRYWISLGWYKSLRGQTFTHVDIVCMLKVWVICTVNKPLVGVWNGCAPCTLSYSTQCFICLTTDYCTRGHVPWIFQWLFNSTDRFLAIASAAVVWSEYRITGNFRRSVGGEHFSQNAKSHVQVGVACHLWRNFLEWPSNCKTRESFFP